jgi:hypothetical protein
VLGPHGIGNRWSAAGTSGHARHTRTAGHVASAVPTSADEAAWRWVRTPHRAAAGLWPLPTRLVSPRTGLAHRPSWSVAARPELAVPTGRAICVPFPARRHRFLTVNHGHSRSSDLQAPYYRCAATRMVGWGRRFDSGGGLHTGSDQQKRWLSRRSMKRLAVQRTHPLLGYGLTVSRPSVLVDSCDQRHCRFASVLRQDHSPAQRLKNAYQAFEPHPASLICLSAQATTGQPGRQRHRRQERAERGWRPRHQAGGPAADRSPQGAVSGGRPVR